MLVNTEALASKRVVKETKRDQLLPFVQSSLMVAPSLQSSRTDGRDAKALADLALHDLVARFGPELSSKLTLRL